MKYHISRQAFEAVFSAAMGVDLMDTGADVIKITPCLIIRDFQAIPLHSDIEFDNESKAWDYFKSHPKCRVMDAAGGIYLDLFDDDSEVSK